MASRQEEKEARRKARMEAEAAERKAASRKRRLWLVLGGVLAAGIVVAVVIALSGGGATGGSDDDAGVRRAKAGAALPDVEITDEEEAAKAAGCTLTNPPDEGRGHESREFTAADYKTNPPTSGVHFPQWAQDGIYEPENVPPLGELVHTLEHGRINVQYKPGTDPKLVEQLETFVAENEGFHMLLYQNPTGMEPQVAATAWTHALACPDPGPKMWDALRTFRDAHISRGPEAVP